MPNALFTVQVDDFLPVGNAFFSWLFVVRIGLGQKAHVFGDRRVEVGHASGGSGGLFDPNVSADVIVVVFRTPVFAFEGRKVRQRAAPYRRTHMGDGVFLSHRAGGAFPILVLCAEYGYGW